MPQGPYELHEKWQDSGNALYHLDAHFNVNRGGVIRKKDAAYEPTAEDLSAIDYLCLEWDYGYEPGNPPPLYMCSTGFSQRPGPCEFWCGDERTCQPCPEHIAELARKHPMPSVVKAKTA
jgi:hypothetical protein